MDERVEVVKRERVVSRLTRKKLLREVARRRTNEDANGGCKRNGILQLTLERTPKLVEVDVAVAVEVKAMEERGHIVRSVASSQPAVESE